MPSIHYLNPPPHPFWDFVANIEDHPFFTAYGRPPAYRFRGTDNSNPAEGPQQEQQPTQTGETSEKPKDRQPTVEDDNEDPPVVDPTTLNTNNTNEKAAEKAPEETRGAPFCGRGRFERAFEDGAPRGGPAWGRGRGGCGGPRGGFGPHHGPHRHGPPHGLPHGPARGPWWARGPPGPDGPPPPSFHDRPCGPPHRRRCSPPSPGRHGDREGNGPFNLGEFLNNLGSRLGIDLSGAAEGLGLERFNAPRTNNDADFEPRADVFDTPAAYLIHLSLPGAKKDDLGVEWDGENSVLRIAGVVHRPGADEELLKHLAVDGRKREVGVFEKNIRLGTKRDPASIDVAGIGARMNDGVLIVKVPKVEVEHQHREVPVTSSGSSSPNTTAEKDVDMEKGTLLDAEDPSDETPVLKATSLSHGVDKEKEAQADREVEMADTRSETVDYEHHEKVPEYEVEEYEHEHEHGHGSSDDEEGDFVKINVD